MQVVINISEEDMEDIVTYGKCNSTKLMISIINGTPLPKGHGRLIDADALLKGIEELQKSPWYNDKRGNGFEYLISEAVETVRDLCVKDAPTVLEADKGDSDE